MPVWSIDVKITGTAYVRANSAREARRKLPDQFDGEPYLGLEMREGGAGDFEISGADFDDPTLPELSLSPAMTVWTIPKSARVNRQA